MGKILDGRAVAAQIRKELAAEVGAVRGRRPCLAAILVGEDPASRLYVAGKARACAEVGIRFLQKEHKVSISEVALLHEIEQLNRDPTVDGILVQLPLPAHIDSALVIEAIAPEKDIDGFHPFNMGKLLVGADDGFFPCTPLGIVRLFERFDLEVAGKHVLIIGRSNIVGKPLAALLLQDREVGNATVTVAHRHTRNLDVLTRMADILVVAVGSPHLVREEMVKEGAVVVDVGINRVEDTCAARGFRVVGDVDFGPVSKRASWITPVPGGVGPMTIAMVLHNTWTSYKRRV